jgi:hypothetical protein
MLAGTLGHGILWKPLWKSPTPKDYRSSDRVLWVFSNSHIC